ncbi:MAG: alpha/beta hydrolase [Phycisphaerales bacterium]
MRLDHRHLDPLVPTERPPMVILLHGYGANMDDLLALGHALDPRLRVVSAQAPVDLSIHGAPGGRAWFNLFMTPSGIDFDRDEASEAVEAASSFVTEAAETYAHDPAQLHVLGFSQGAMMAHAMVLARSVPITGAMACSGRMIESLFEAKTDTDDLEGFPILVTHGSLDEVIPISSGRAIRDWYAETPAELTWGEYEMGHGIGPECMADLQGWMRGRLGPPAG